MSSTAAPPQSLNALLGTVAALHIKRPDAKPRHLLQPSAARLGNLVNTSQNASQRHITLDAKLQERGIRETACTVRRRVLEMGTASGPPDLYGHSANSDAGGVEFGYSSFDPRVRRRIEDHEIRASLLRYSGGPAHL